MYFAEGAADKVIGAERVSGLIDSMLGKLGKPDRVLILPPDTTRFHSFAGEITRMLYEKLKYRSHIEIMPALGTHAPLTAEEMNSMYPGVPRTLFRTHDWLKDVTRMGTIPPGTTREMTGGLADWPVHCEINKTLAGDNWDQIISVGQLVPHELAGIANHNKNILIGTGGKDIIGKSHMIGALHGLEKTVGSIETPMRTVLNYMSMHFTAHLPVSYILTVRGTGHGGQIVTRGVFAGNDEACYLEGARLCRQVNIRLLRKAYRKVVAYMDPEEFKSTWVGNKAIFRTSMAVADGGELIILCPGIRTFGENRETDSFIRKYGYMNREALMEAVRKNKDMDNNLTPLAHLLISSPENRFRIIYAARDISGKDIESVHCHYADYHEMVRKYDPSRLKDGENIMPGGEEIFYVPNPGQGLWAETGKFKKIHDQ